MHGWSVSKLGALGLLTLGLISSQAAAQLADPPAWPGVPPWDETAGVPPESAVPDEGLWNAIEAPPAFDIAPGASPNAYGNSCDRWDGDECCGEGCCGALCLFGGHDVPYDFCYDALGVSPDSCFDVGGWVQFGYHTRSDGQFNRHPHRFNNHQSWVYMEKRADGNLGFDWGFRVDAMYGVDADDTQAFGNNPGRWDFRNGFDHGIYGGAIPQLYVDIAYQDFSLRLGHFYTLLGYEVVSAPGNFFYSHSLTMYNSEAFTHTGAVATCTVDEDIELYLGWTEGWDTGFDRFAGAGNFLGGARLQLTEVATLAFITTFGDFGKIGDGYSHSLVLDIQVTRDLNYVFQSDLLHTNQPWVAGPGGAGGPVPQHAPSDSTNTVGINQYLIYDVNEWLAVGGRAEWWKADGASYYEITGGVNIRPAGNLIIRPEVRYQWSPTAQHSTGFTNADNPAGLPVNEGAIFGVDAILTF